MAEPVDPANPALEAAIVRNPKDEAAWRVYADWLNEQGAPRGELAALQIAREAKRLPSLREKAEALLEEHEELFWGEGYDEAIYEVRWKAGFWKTLRLHMEPDIGYAELFALRSARLLQSIIAEGSMSPSDLVEGLAKAGPHPALRRLKIEEQPDWGNNDVGSFTKLYCEGLDKLVAPNLRWLTLNCDGCEFGSFPNLRRLELDASLVEPETLRALFATKFPRLRSLELFVGTITERERRLYDPDVDLTPFTIGDFDGMLDGTRLPRLTKLRIGSNEAAIIDELKARIEKAPIRKQLTDLALTATGNKA